MESKTFSDIIQLRLLKQADNPESSWWTIKVVTVSLWCFDGNNEDTNTEKHVWSESSSQAQKCEDSHQKLKRQETDGPPVSQWENGHRDSSFSRLQMERINFCVVLVTEFVVALFFFYNCLRKTECSIFFSFALWPHFC